MTPARRNRCITACLPEGKSDKPQEQAFVKNTEFGYSRKDVTLITFGLIALGYALYYGLQAGGMEAGIAGNYVQLAIFVGICIGWVSTYLFRVATKVSSLKNAGRTAALSCSMPFSCSSLTWLCQALKEHLGAKQVWSATCSTSVVRTRKLRTVHGCALSLTHQLRTLLTERSK